MARCEAATRSEGSIVLISGEAGSGKTRLVEEARLLAPAGMFSAIGACFDFVRTPYGPIVEALTAMLAAFPGCVPPQPGFRAALASVMPALEAADVSIPIDGDTHKRWLFDAAVELIGRFAAKMPLYFIVEDIHWADAATTELLRYFAHHLGHFRICTVVTARSEDQDRIDYVQQAFSDLARNPVTTRITLKPLDEEEALELLQRTLTHGANLNTAARRRIVALADGQPLFIEELARSAETSLSDPATALPTSIDATIKRRLANFAPEHISILEAAAVYGRRFTLHDIEAISGCDEPALARTLRVARDSMIVRAIEGERNTFEFGHELVRKAIVATMTARDQESLHVATARYLETIDDPNPVMLAHHLQEAGEPANAARYHEASGDVAAAAFAYEDAANEYLRALQTSALATDASARLHRKVAQMYHVTASPVRARSHFESAIRLYTELDDELEALDLRISLASNYARLTDLQAARDACLECANMVGADRAHPRLYAIHAFLAEYYLLLEEPEEAQHHLKLAEEAHDTGTAEDVYRYHQSKAIVAFMRGNLVEWHNDADHAAASLGALIRAETRCGTRFNLASLSFEIGDFKRARQFFEEGIRDGVDSRLDSLTAYLRLGYAELCTEAGDLALATTLVESVARLGIDAPFVRIALAAVGIPLALATRNDELLDASYDPALLEVARATKEPARFGPVAAAFAKLAVDATNADRAGALLAEAIGVMNDVSANHETILTVARSGLPETVLHARGILASSLKRRPNDRTRAYLELFDSLSCERVGKAGAAKEHAGRAAHLFRRIGARTPLCEALALAGSKGEALALAMEIGDDRRLALIQAKDAESPRRHDLSPRELEIAELVAHGISNRVIADKLVLSVRTVEHHVSAVLRKTRTRSRSELTANWPVIRAGVATADNNFRSRLT